ncbi:MAG: hypothetical protein R2941_21230 [Desulfobacterales bacterium]
MYEALKADDAEWLELNGTQAAVFLPVLRRSDLVLNAMNKTAGDYSAISPSPFPMIPITRPKWWCRLL